MRDVAVVGFAQRQMEEFDGSPTCVELLVPLFAGRGPQVATAVAVIATFAALNYRGAKPGALAIDMFTVAKFAVLLLLIATLVPKVSLSIRCPRAGGGPHGATTEAPARAVVARNERRVIVIGDAS